MTNKYPLMILFIASILTIAVLTDRITAHSESDVAESATQEGSQKLSNVVYKKVKHPDLIKQNKNDSLKSRLDNFKSLKQKAIMTREERIDWERLLSNPDLINDAENTLLTIKPEALTRETQKERFHTLSYLEKALEWSNNPSKQEVIDVVEKVILTPLSGDLAVRKNFVGDKMELYAMLLVTAPEKASSILANSRGTSLENILNYTAKRLTF